jgi:predicted secreted protein
MTQQKSRVAEPQVPEEESKPKLSATTRSGEPVASQAEEEAPTEARLVDIASILGALTVTVVRYNM